MAVDIQYLLDHELAGASHVPIRCVLKTAQHTTAGYEYRLVVKGLNLVQGDTELGTYIELEVEEE